MQHPITLRVRRVINNYPTDAATKAGIFAIYQHSGKLKALSELRHLTLNEQEWFSHGLEAYLKDSEHPARDSHALIHYGRAVYYLSLLYFISLAIWVSVIVNTSITSERTIKWASLWQFIGTVSLFTVAITFYGIYIESQAKNRTMTQTHRIMAIFSILVLVIAITSNFLTPIKANSQSYMPFFTSATADSR